MPHRPRLSGFTATGDVDDLYGLGRNFVFAQHLLDGASGAVETRHHAIASLVDDEETEILQNRDGREEAYIRQIIVRADIDERYMDSPYYIAPTDEVRAIASELQEPRLVILVLFSLLVSYRVVFSLRSPSSPITVSLMRTLTIACSCTARLS